MLKPAAPAAISRTIPQELALSGSWTARGIGEFATELDALSAPSGSPWIGQDSCSRPMCASKPIFLADGRIIILSYSRLKLIQGRPGVHYVD